MKPLEPTLTAHLFAPLGRELVTLLRSLPPEAWARDTVCRGWSVSDVAAHLLDSALRRLAFVRDGHRPPSSAVNGYADLVVLLDGLNADWVKAARRLSPRLLTDLLEWVEPQLAEHLASLDPFAEAPFPVAWAGETGSRAWFDVARELTERWHHQQQIRLATGAPPLADAETTLAVMRTFLRVLPHRYRDVAAPDGAALVVAVEAAPPIEHTLLSARGAWQLLAGRADAPSCTVEIALRDAWLLLTKGLSADAARAGARVVGDAALAGPFFTAIAVMG